MRASYYLNFTRFVVIVAIFSFSFKKNAFFNRVIELVLICALFAIPLSSNWSRGISNANIIAGFIPYKDGFYYYNGAQKLLLGYPITGDGLQGAFRPLMPALLSVFLQIFNHHLQAVLALIVFLTAYAVYLSAHAFREKTGPLPAALLLALTYAFILPMVGFTLTELPSLMFSCLSFFFFIKCPDTPKWLNYGVGVTLLILAISIRAGTFFILPLLLIWFFWTHRHEGKKGLLQTAVFAGLILLMFVAANMMVPAILTQNSSTFGNFSWMLYGQAVGGAGWMYHFEALRTSDPNIVLNAALQKIASYPLGLIIGTAKSYRDFFSPGHLGIFYLIVEKNHFLNAFLWTACMLLTVIGLIRTIKKHNSQLNTLFLAGFLGIFLSIPFLPPVDGGNRFYAGCIPYFFAIPALGVQAFRDRTIQAQLTQSKGPNQKVSSHRWVSSLAIFFILTTTVIPISLFAFRKQQSFRVPKCPDGQMPINLEISNGAYVDIIQEPSMNRSASTYALTLASFINNNTDKMNDDFYQEMIRLGQVYPDGYRIAAIVERISLKYYFAVIPLQLLKENDGQEMIIGCAQEVKTQFQRILLVNQVQN